MVVGWGIGVGEDISILVKFSIFGCNNIIETVWSRVILNVFFTIKTIPVAEQCEHGQLAIIVLLAI